MAYKIFQAKHKCLKRRFTTCVEPRAPKLRMNLIIRHLEEFAAKVKAGLEEAN